MKQGVKQEEGQKPFHWDGRKTDDRSNQYTLEGFPTEYLKLFGKGCGEMRKSLKCVPRILCGGGGGHEWNTGSIKEYSTSQSPFCKLNPFLAQNCPYFYFKFKYLNNSGSQTFYFNS